MNDQDDVTLKAILQDYRTSDATLPGARTRQTPRWLGSLGNLILGLTTISVLLAVLFIILMAIIKALR